MKKKRRGKRIDRRQFLHRGLCAGISGLFAGMLFELRGRPEGEERRRAAPSQPARRESELAG